MTNCSTFPKSVQIFEVGPRDGLQAFPEFIPTERKIRLIMDLLDAGCRNVEVASFVSPKVTPQMRDGREILARLPKFGEHKYSVLVPNLEGLDSAAGLNVDRICVGTAASEQFLQANMNASVKQSLERIEDIVSASSGAPFKISGYISCIAVCPFSGPVKPELVADLTEQLLELGCDDVFLAETVGQGTFGTISRVADAVLQRVPAGRIGIHFHDTYGQALANILPCLERGIAMIDSSVAGLGGCPIVPGAAGNVGTEDVLFLLNSLGIAPDVDLPRLAEIGVGFCGELGLTHRSKAGRTIFNLQQLRRQKTTE